MTVLLADMGGTNIRFAVMDGQTLGEIVRFKCADFDTFESAVACFLQKQKASPAFFVLAVPAPVTEDELTFVNNPWRFKISDIKKQFAFHDIKVVNDFTAQAWALSVLPKDSTLQIGGGVADKTYPALIIGAGTGLGVGIFYPDENGHPHVLPSEGGHIALAPTNAAEEKICMQTVSRFGRMSAERIISGRGLSFLYECMYGLNSSSEQIMESAAKGDTKACSTVAQMFAFLGDFCGDLALALCAKGGIYLSGGVLQSQHACDSLPQSEFRTRFESKGRHTPYMQQIPTYLVCEKNVAFMGLKALAQNYFSKK